MPRLSVPNAARLPSSLRVDSSNTALIKALGRLSRESLISLALDWIHDSPSANTLPYITRGAESEDEDDEDPDDLYPPCHSLQELEDLYTEMQNQKGSKRDVVSRILEGDWRHGLTMYQYATVDLRYLDEHPTSQKWSAYHILPLKKGQNDDDLVKVDEESLEVPQFHPATFLQRLQGEVLPDIKAHYHFYRPKDYPVLILRIFVIDSPYSSSLAFSSLDSNGSASFDSSRTLYIAFPNGAPALYITKSQRVGASGSGESKSLHSLIVDGVPKALSRPRQRYTLKALQLTTKNLDALLDKKGSGRGNAAGGGWSIYADEKHKDSPLDAVMPKAPLSKEPSAAESSPKRQLALRPSERAAKRAKMVAQARFGRSAMVSDGKGMEKVEFIIKDPFPSTEGLPEDDTEEAEQPSRNKRRDKLADLEEEAEAGGDSPADGQETSGWAPLVKVTLQGPHVFAGVRQLVEAGIIDGERMPGWLTGEEGVSVGVVKQGRVQGHKGSGL
ncbi:centromere protein Chl4/mis15/CENP-N [Stachybotrys elegans]|uniref:Centromere protein Chl4/mis15/CENP-N n=1 Tax=Stachybotrys elegans TaxID=80388 RepID=A0A8K0SUK6_9HYPO|nr:centromere protein Chl4/mis15/CENP-N [Stachybotrys elegans]